MTLRRSERGGGVNEEPERIAEAIKDSLPRQEIRVVAPAWQGMQRRTLFWCWWEKILGGPKNNQLLNATIMIAWNKHQDKGE